LPHPPASFSRVRRRYKPHAQGRVVGERLILKYCDA
jgi:hypothetical protein